MPIKFNPIYTITPEIVNSLMRIEAAKEKVAHLPLTAKLLNSLRETARLYTTHYSTMIEGNKLEPDQVEAVLKHNEHFPDKERDEKEVKGYYTAIAQIENWAARGDPITENMIQILHALVMGGGRAKVKPTSYRDGQNAIRDSRSGVIVYMPPEYSDVPGLMKGLVYWLKSNETLPCPVLAGIAHYQFATIHPYYDGNGRTARLLTSLILHLGGYDLKGLYSLEEYYARNLGNYYDAISIGPSHNYYMGQAQADITRWVDYFICGMAVAFENIFKRMNHAQKHGDIDQTEMMRKLDRKQRQALQLFEEFETVTASQIGKLFGFKPRTSAQLCKTWTNAGFLDIVDFSNKGRKYRLAKKYKKLIE